MLQLLIQVFRGVIIGMANIIPGVSGGTMMVSMGIYDTLIHCITHLFKEFWRSVKTLLPYAVGMIVAIVALASLLNMLMERYALPTSTAFIGLILGGLSPLFHKISRKRINWIAVLMFLIFFALVVVMALAGEVDNSSDITLNLGQVLMLVLMGAIAAATMLIPGVSGSMMLMLFGYYGTVIKAIEGLKNAVFGGGLSSAAVPFFTLLPFGVGVVLGIFGVAKLIEWLLKRFPTYTYCGVLGLVIASPIAILLRTDMSGVNWISVLISLLTFAAGYAVAALFAKSGAAHTKPEANRA